MEQYMPVMSQLYQFKTRLHETVMKLQVQQPASQLCSQLYMQLLMLHQLVFVYINNWLAYMHVASASVQLQLRPATLNFINSLFPVHQRNTLEGQWVSGQLLLFTKILCLYKTLIIPCFLHKNIQLVTQAYTKNNEVIMKLWMHFKYHFHNKF